MREKRSKLGQHPAGVGATIGFAIVCILTAAGVDLSAVEAGGIAGGIGAVVSLFTPREEYA